MPRCAKDDGGPEYLCPHCDYAVGYLNVLACPECGGRLPPLWKRYPADHRTLQWSSVFGAATGLCVSAYGGWRMWELFSRHGFGRWPYANRYGSGTEVWWVSALLGTVLICVMLSLTVWCVRRMWKRL